jgi:exodeoxyribonuclease III
MHRFTQFQCACASVTERLETESDVGSQQPCRSNKCISVKSACKSLVQVFAYPAGSALKRLEYRTQEWDVAFTSYLGGLRKEKPVVLTGDMNCAREPIDIHNARNNLKSAGFTPEERESFQKVRMLLHMRMRTLHLTKRFIKLLTPCHFLGCLPTYSARISVGCRYDQTNPCLQLYIDAGWVDTFREQHPGVYGYTYFGYRANPGGKRVKGWRLDYFLVSSELANRRHDSFILQDYNGSDHVPLGLVLNQQESP